MQQRPLGTTGLTVSEIGLGAAQLGEDQSLPEAQAERVLRQALDLGINYIDTAAMYGKSEEYIGRYISNRKDEFILATKCGDYETWEGGDRVIVKDYSYDGILKTIDTSRRKLKMDVLDIVQFHSVPGDDDDSKAAYEALLEAKHRGWTRFVGISQDGEKAAEAATEWPLDTLTFTYNILYQEAGEILFPTVRDRRMGAIIKRPITNAIWQVTERPTKNMMIGPWERVKTFPLVELAGDMPLIEFTLRFTLSRPDFSTAIVGTTNPDHLIENARVSDGQVLPEEVLRKCRQAYVDQVAREQAG